MDGEIGRFLQDNSLGLQKLKKYLPKLKQMLMDYFGKTWRNLVKIVTTREGVRTGLTILNFYSILEVVLILYLKLFMRGVWF